MERDIVVTREMVIDAIKFNFVTRAQELTRIEGEIRLSTDIGGTALTSLQYEAEDLMYRLNPGAYNEVSIRRAPAAIGQLDSDPILHFMSDPTGERYWEDVAFPKEAAIGILQDADAIDNQPAS